MVKVGLATSNQYECGSVQTAEHMLQESLIMRPLCSISDINSEELLEHLSWTLILTTTRSVLCMRKKTTCGTPKGESII